MATPESESFIRTFARGLKIIEVMGESGAPRTIAQIAEATALPRTAVRRFLMTLTELAFVRTDGKLFWLTPRVLKLGLSYLYTLPYWRHAQIVLEELAARISQSCAISVLDENDIVYVQRLHTKRILSMSPTLGSRLPAHVVSMGRVMLAALPPDQLDTYLSNAEFKSFTANTVVDPEALRSALGEVRTKGYAWVDGELDESICGLAVAVKDGKGEVVAAVNVSLVAGTITEASAVERYLPDLRLAAAQLRESSR